MNEQLIRETIAKIHEVGEQGWDQRSFVSECGTASCFAGWAMRLSGYGITRNRWNDGYDFRTPDGSRSVFLEGDARRLLGLTEDQASAIFYFIPGPGRVDEDCGCGTGVDEFIKHVEHVTGLEGL